MNSALAITNITYRNGKRVNEIDTRQATHQGKPWISLSGFQKRKFETLVLAANDQEPTHIIYH